MRRVGDTLFVVMLALFVCTTASAQEAKQLEQAPNTWVKRSPLPDAPPSPMLGYEGSFGYDPIRKLLIRWAGHNQGGGGEQNAETWTFDPATAKWTLKEPNCSPPGVCCAQQNLFDPVGGRFLRFQAFAGSHGWQWFREIYLNNSSVWSYDLGKNTWRDMRAYPAPRLASLRCASWDSEFEVVVIFGGEGSHEGTVVYDPFTNTWTRMKPPVEPKERSGGNMAYDAARRRHILFGLQFGDDPHTWAYDLRKNAWLDLQPKTMPPTKESDPVLAYDVESRSVVAVVQVIDKKEGDESTSGHHETWIYDSAANDWKRASPSQEPQGWGNRRRIMQAIPDQNVVLMESYVNPTSKVPGVDREQQIWTYRVGEKSKTVQAPRLALKATATADHVKLEWPADSGAAVFALHAGEGDAPWNVNFEFVKRLMPGTTSYEDRAVKPGVVRYYYLEAFAPDGKSSTRSSVARSQPAIVEDVVASVKSAKEVQLAWPKAKAEDIAGYHVERAAIEVYSEDQIIRLAKDTAPLEQPSVGAIKAIGPFKRITEKPIAEAKFADGTIDLEKVESLAGEPIYTRTFNDDQRKKEGKAYRFAVYAYRVRAVNQLGVESGPSPLAYTIPSSPQKVFSRESSDVCMLKWATNPESDLKGYRIYRMESPRINGPGQPVTRITPEPISATTYADPDAKKLTRRYWIVAVDALGQEGFPSAPTWYERQYKAVYDKFTEKWHQ